MHWVCSGRRFRSWGCHQVIGMGMRVENPFFRIWYLPRRHGAGSYRHSAYAVRRFGRLKAPENQLQSPPLWIVAGSATRYWMLPYRSSIKPVPPAARAGLRWLRENFK